MKLISGHPKIKALDTWKRIQSGRFTEHEIDNILIALRNFAGDSRLFVEVANFVAHGDRRDRGVANRSLQSMYLSMTYFSEYVSPKIALDISKPFPSYIKELMKCDLEKCDSHEFRREFGVSVATVKRRIDKIFKDDRKSKLCCAKKPISPETLKILSHLLGAIRSKPVFSGEDFVDELIAVAQRNNLDVVESEVRLHGEKIIVCVLLLLHAKDFSYGGTKPGRSALTCEKPSIPIGPIKQSKDNIDFGQFGSLMVNGIVSVKSRERFVDVAFPLMTTKQLARDWCDESLFVEEDIADQLADNFEQYFSIRFDASQELYVTEEFKLCAYMPQEEGTSQPKSLRMNKVLLLGLVGFLILSAIFIGVGVLRQGN